MQTLSGKTVMITCAGGGIGRALVSAFAAKGCRIVACDRDTGLLDDLGVAERVAFDLIDSASIAGAVARMDAPDILVNNAGWTRAETMDDVSDAVIEKELALNLTGVMHLTQSILPGRESRPYSCSGSLRSWMRA